MNSPNKYSCANLCVCVCACMYVWVSESVCVHISASVRAFACICARVTSPISMEIKHCSSHKFTHSPCFDSIQSTVCIITLVPYGNLLGPKYCSLTNPSFVFSRYTKHQSYSGTHTTQQTPPLPPLCAPPLVCTHTHARTSSHAPTHSLERQSSVELKAGWLEQQDMLRSGFVINISLFQMVPPTKLKDTTTGPADRKGPCLGRKDKTKIKNTKLN